MAAIFMDFIDKYFLVTIHYSVAFGFAQWATQKVASFDKH